MNLPITFVSPPPDWQKLVAFLASQELSGEIRLSRMSREKLDCFKGYAMVISDDFNTDELVIKVMRK